MFRQNFHVMLTFVLLLYLRLFLEAHAVSDVCKLCECKSQRVSCEYLDLSSVPQNISGTVEYFYLSNNKITKIEDESFRNLLSLESLQLDNNEISNIEKESLKHLSNLEQLYLQNNTISNIEHGTFQGLNSLQILRLCNNSISKIEKETFVNLPELYEIRLSDNKISKIEKESFVNLPKLKEIDLSSNAISSLKQHTFKKLTGLKTLDLSNNKMSSITQETFQNLYSLEDLNLSRNQIQMIEDGAFLFLPNIKKINLIGNKNLKCGYHLPAVVNYMTSTYNRTVDVLGKCLRGLDNEEDEPISIMNHTQSKYYSLFQKNLQCQTCSGMMCNDSEVTNCTGAELVCQYKLSMSGVTLKFERFCSTYRNCLEAMRNNTSTCNEWANGTSCVACCSGNQCNKNDFMDWNNTFEYHLIYTIDRHPISKNCNEYKNHFENVSRAIEHALSTLRGSFKVEYSGLYQSTEIFTIYRTVLITSDNKDHVLRNISNILNTSQALRDLGVQQSDMTLIDDENIEPVTTKLLNISQKLHLKKEDIDLVVKNLEKMMPLIRRESVNIILRIILHSINNIINAPEKILVEAEKANRTVSRMLDIIEIIPEKIPLEKQQVVVSYSNLAIGAAKVEKDTFNGLVFAVSFGTNETEARSEIYNGSIPQAEDKMDYISLPKRLFKHLKDEEQSVFSRISIFCLRNDKLYRLIQNSSSQAITKIGSRIIAANIPNVKIADLDEPVKISFNVTGQTATNPQCVYWDDSPGQNPHWSSKGCNTSNDVSGENVVCSCNHLTSFALLMDAHQKGKKTNSRLLSIISNVGCGISFVCLILTVIIHAYFKNLWKLIASKILVNLCISLAVTYLIFLVGFQEYSTKLTAVCKAMAALLHYSLLSSFMWMSVEALHIYLGLFVFKTIRSSFIKRSSILVWGIPAVIVTITLAINNTNNYNRVEHVCWLSNAAFYAALLAPVVIILFFNLVIFVCVMWRVNSMRNDKQAEHKTKKVRVFGILGLCVLLGFPWILAFFAFGEAAEAFQFLFAIFNTLQGMFIFMCYCIYKKDTRDVVCLFVCKRKTGDPMEARQFFKSSISNHETECKKAETNA